MDNATLHILLTCLLGIVTGTVSFLIKGVLKRVETMEKDLANHKLEDTAAFAALNAKSDEVSRRFDQIDHKLEKIADRLERVIEKQ